MNAETPTTWVAVGSSPTVPEFLEPAIERAGPGALTIACNAAILRFLIRDRGPDYYWVSDWVACDRYRDYHEWAQRNRGTEIVTLGRDGPGALEQRGLGNAHHLIDASPPSHTIEWERGTYTNARTSGALIVQFAVNRGAKAVHVVGMEGYLSTPGKVVVDTFDGRLGKDNGGFHAKECQTPLFNLIAQKCPDVAFTFYGKQRFPIQGANVTWVNRDALQRKVAV